MAKRDHSAGDGTVRLSLLESYKLGTLPSHPFRQPDVVARVQEFGGKWLCGSAMSYRRERSILARPRVIQRDA